MLRETRTDPHTLNVHLNENFSDVTVRILRFLVGIAPSKRIHELHRDLGFYDLQVLSVAPHPIHSLQHRGEPDRHTFWSFQRLLCGAALHCPVLEMMEIVLHEQK